MASKSKQSRQTQMKTLVVKWQKSNLSRYKFAKQHGISYRTFDYWVKKYEKEKNGNLKSPFLPVRIS